MATGIYITDDGRILAFDPSDYRRIPEAEDLKAGKYEPPFESRMSEDGSTVRLTVSQLMMPLARIRLSTSTIPEE